MSEAADVFDGLVAPSNKQLKSIADLGKEARRLEQTISEMEEAVSAYKKDLNKILVIDLPQAMAEAGTEKFKLTDGAEIAVKSFISGSLPKLPEKRVKALSWIIKNGGESLIKASIDIALDRGDKKTAAKIEAFLKKSKVDFASEEAIHPQTLQAWVRERLENGEPTPLEDLGLFAGKVAKITAAKVSKKAPIVAAGGRKAPGAAPAGPKGKSQPLARKGGEAPKGNWDERNPPPHDHIPY